MKGTLKGCVMEYRVPLNSFAFMIAEAWRKANGTGQDERWQQCFSHTSRILREAIASGEITPVETTLSYPVDATDPDAYIKLSEVVAYGKAKGIWWGNDVPSLAKGLGFVDVEPASAQTTATTAPVVAAAPASSDTLTLTTTPPPVVTAMPDRTLLATREQLINAFKSFTGMDKTWFSNITDTPALLAARKVTGQGGRGHIAEPLFCPFEVQQWLIDPARRKGRPLGPDKGWELFESYFPRAYAAFSVGDTRTD